MPKKIKKNDQKLWKDSHTAKLKIRLFNEVFIIHVSLDMTVKELKKTCGIGNWNSVRPTEANLLG